MSRTPASLARRVAGLSLVIVAVVSGCRPAPGGAVGTGARETALAFAQAIVACDWPRAYGLLAAESKGRIGADQFARLAQQYRVGLGFEPAAAHVTACEEHGTEAIAHVALTGKGPHRGRFKDDLTLRNDAGTWGVVLPTNFGRSR